MSRLIADRINGKLTPEEVAALLSEFRESFKLFDKDGDGQITIQELGTVMRKLGQNPSEAELKQMIADLDVDKNGTVDFNEFISMYEMKKRDDDKEDEEEVLAAFKAFDRNRDGFISADELRHVMKCLGEKLSLEEVEEMIRSSDVDGNGKIDYHEFTKFLLEKGLKIP